MRIWKTCLGTVVLVVIAVIIIAYWTEGRNKIALREAVIRRDNGTEIVAVIGDDSKSGINASFCDVINKKRNISIVPGYNSMPNQQAIKNETQTLKEVIK